jgi:hypothetical protein
MQEGKFAESFRDELRENAERLAAEAGIEIEFLRKRNVRKEDRVKEILARRGSILDWCACFRPWSYARLISRGITRRRARPS